MEIINEQFKKFRKKIALTKSQNKDARKKYKGVCKKLHDHYYEEEYNGNTNFLFGSYGKKTNIRPPRDVDVIFKLPWDEYERYDSYEGNGQSQFLQDVKKILSSKYTTTEKIRGWGKVVLVEFSENYHNVEVLPAFENDDKTFTIANTEDGGSWEIFDPRKDVEEIKEADKKAEGKFRYIAQISKKWVENISINIKSYKLERLLLDCFESDSDFFDKRIPEIFLAFLKYLKDSHSGEVASHIQTACNRAKKAIDFEKEGKEEKAIEEWIKVFGDDFPKTFDKKASTQKLDNQIIALQNRYPSSQEEFLDKDYNITFSINPNYNLEIDAKVIQNGFRDGFLSIFLAKGSYLAVRKSLEFQIIKNNVPTPYDIYWKVRNFGDEAQKKGKLRGEIIKDKAKNGKELKRENTEYRGEHYVECYCVVNGTCVALDKILVPINYG